MTEQRFGHRTAAQATGAHVSTTHLLTALPLPSLQGLHAGQLKSYWLKDPREAKRGLDPKRG